VKTERIKEDSELSGVQTWKLNGKRVKNGNRADKKGPELSGVQTWKLNKKVEESH